MQNIKTIFENKKYLILTITVFAFWIIFTAKLAFLSGRLRWEDESHFWVIVKNCSIAQIFELMKVEGHMMLWYLVVKPFTFLPYPYPMQVINWLFCLGAMIISWRKAPFNCFTKTLILISPVFLQLYPVHARCYSISCFFLFLACAFYKERLNKPYLYFFILFLAANTHIQTFFASTAIGLLFLYDLIKSKRYKETILISLMTILTGIMFIFQFYGVSKPDYENVVQDIVNSTNMVGIFIGSIQIENDWILLSKIISARIFVVVMTLIFATKARAFFVYIFIFFTSIIFFENVYLPRIWHIAFFLVYFVVCYWIFLEERTNLEQERYKNIIKYFNKFVYILLLVQVISLEINLTHDRDFLYSTLIQHEELQQGKLFTDIWPITVSISLPQLNEKGIYIYDMNGRDLSSFEGLMTYYDEEKKKFKSKNIYNYIETDKNNYLITLYDISKNKKYKDIKKKLYLEGIKNGYNYFIYKIF